MNTVVQPQGLLARGRRCATQHAGQRACCASQAAPSRQQLRHRGRRVVTRAEPAQQEKAKPSVPSAPPSQGGAAKQTSSNGDGAGNGASPVSLVDGEHYEELHPELDPNAPRFEEWPPQRPWDQVVRAKLSDTAADLALILRRTLLPLPTKSRVSSRRRQGALDKLAQGRPREEATRVLQGQRPLIVVLGSGWGAHALIKVVDTEKFDVVVISPRNFFIFTPMLPSSAVGTVEFRSLLEPIRTANPFVSYLEAECDEVNLETQRVHCTSAVAYEDGTRPSFDVPYDLLVVAVGEQSATFGVPGVREHCFFMKEITDSVGLRNRISNQFELAAIPGTSEEERRRALTFVVVGGGPTGVEFAGTLADFVRVDLRAKYSPLMKFVRVVLLQSGQSILTMFAASLQERALKSFEKSGVEVRLNVRVVRVNPHEVELSDGEKIQAGVVVWSAGNSARPVVKSLSRQLPPQREFFKDSEAPTMKLAVDPFLRVVGAQNVVSLGDCAAMHGNRLPATAQVAGQQGAYLARIINKGYQFGKGGLTEAFPYRRSAAKQSSPLSVFASYDGDAARAAGGPLEYTTKPFEFLSLGLLAYIGNDRALTQIDAGPRQLQVAGRAGFLLWRSVYLVKQVSLRNRVLILVDWTKTRIFGRDLSIF